MVAAAKLDVDASAPRGGHDTILADEAPTDRPFAPKARVVPAQTSWAGEYPFRSRWLGVGTRSGQHLWMHYLDEGPRDAPVVVALHGNPTWSFYWRTLVLALRDRYRVIVPDHVGMGLSDRPQAWPYRLTGHVGNVQALLDALGVSRFSLAVHDWGGAIGMGVAVARPNDVDKLIVTNTAAFRSKDIPLSIASVRIPVFGKLAVLGCNAFAWAATIRAVEKPLAPAAKRGLLAPYGNAHDRIATLRFVEDIPMKDAHPSWETLGDIEQKLPLLKDKPMQLLWGDADFCFTPKFRKRWMELFPRAAVHAWPEVGHYVMEDAPERALPLMRTFLDGRG
ncbi:MAG: alpha/beta fold hydrolase [Deltaproteobacteria bacterium]|nr:alpha/beta fold hydrolase [Deltaproteobacteria bacterium]